jgi:DNA-binding transcriptional regulator LsrR (DeoR family)
MTPEYAANSVEKARESLREYARMRDDLARRVRVAHALGIKKADIARLATISRTTVDRLVDGPGK